MSVEEGRPGRVQRYPGAGARAGLLVVVVLAAVGVAVWGWFGWLPNYRPALRPGERIGVDVSGHQGRIAWAQVARDGMGFAYIKASEGADFVDPWFQRNWAAAGAAGLDRGAYHFFTLCQGGAKQAANFLRTVPADSADLPPAVDLELAGNCAARPDRVWLDREFASFLRAVETATGDSVVVYLGTEFDRRYHIRDTLGRPLWQRSLLRRPGGHCWLIWQFHARAHVDGINTAVDLDVMTHPSSRPTDPPCPHR